MTTFKKAYQSFVGYQERQSKVSEALQLQIREADKQIELAQAELLTTISRTFPTLETFPHAELTKAATEAELPKNFTLLISALQSDNASVEGDRDALIQQFGDPSQVQKRLEATRAERAQNNGEWRELERSVVGYNDDLKPWDRFLRDKMGMESPSLEQMSEVLNYCKGFGLARTFDQNWHEGRIALNSVRHHIFGVDHLIPHWQKREAARAEFAVVDAAGKEIQGRFDADDIAMKAFARVDAKYFPPEKIIQRLHEEILESLFNEEFVSALSKQLGDEIVGPLFLPVAKIHNLQQMKALLEPAAEIAADTLGKIEEPLAKLKKGAAKAPDREVDIDLKAVDKVIEANEKMGEYYADNAKAARKQIGSSTYSSRDYKDSGGADINMLMMTYYMYAPIYSDPSCDPAFVNCIVSAIDAGCAPTLSDASPTSLSALHNAFDASTGLPHISNLEPNAMPDLGSIPSVPDISVPSVDSGHSGGSFSPGASSYGDSSSGSYGGYSSGSGYDGGGGFSGGDGGGGGF